jgi:xanthine dehydrogenase accessory factor
VFDPERLSEIARGPQPAALCTVVQTSGSTPRKIGASMVVVADGSELGQIVGTIGGGAVEHRVRAEAIAAIAETRPRSVELALTTQLGMCCGGQMTVFIDPLRQRPPCLIFGAGHCGQALARAADLAGFRVQVADPRDELHGQFGAGIELIEDYEDEDLDDMSFGPDAFVIVVTHDHAMDQTLCERILRREHRYLALVGSQRKARLTRQRCLSKGIAPERVEAMRSPAGLDIGAETPEEIAVSIVAEMVQVRRRVGAAGAEPASSGVKSA